MTKADMISAIVKRIAPGDCREQARLRKHHNARTTAQVRETYGRQCGAPPTQHEINLHCQFDGLRKLGK